MPLLSIIMPAYNVEEFINTAINSVLNQTFKDFEFIIINDGSTDSTKKIIKEHAEKDLRIIFIDKNNEGVSNTRNRGIEIASGKYISFIDSDDYLDLDLYKNMLEKAECTNSDLVMCGCIKETIKANKIISRMTDNVEENIYDTGEDMDNLIRETVNNLLFNYVWNKLYKREIINNRKIQFNNTSIGEDTLFNLSYTKYINRIATVEGVYYHYTLQRLESLVRSYNANKYNLLNLVDKEMEETFKLLGMDSKIDKTILANIRVKNLLACYNSLFHSKCDMKIMGKYKFVKASLNQQELQNAIKYISFHEPQYKLRTYLLKRKFILLTLFYSFIWCRILTNTPRLFRFLQKATRRKW
jgi:glycosyltransferase involved in cell wall biosynthesis